MLKLDAYFGGARYFVKEIFSLAGHIYHEKKLLTEFFCILTADWF